MLTSSANHYLRTEYLNPLQGNNIELDAKKSPLALLAQTCSQIGADAPQKNAGTPSGDKSNLKVKVNTEEKPPSNNSQACEGRRSSSATLKPFEKKKNCERTNSPPLQKRSLRDSHEGFSSSQARSLSRGGDSDGDKTPLNVLDIPQETSSYLPASRCSPPTPVTSAASHNIATLMDISKSSLASYKLTPSLYSPLGICLDQLGTSTLSALSAKVATSNPLVVSNIGSPYIGYTRVKTANAEEVIIPICRDPYCTGCQINTHALQVVNGTCTPGCSQCAQIAAHSKALSSLPSNLISSLSTTSLHNLYLSSGLFGGTNHPYVCNWIAGETYCGKRYTSSEELLQHLRSHTNIISTESASLPLSTLHQHPLLIGHSSLSRGYPTPPLSPLSAAARYHPYAKAQFPHLPSSTTLSSASAFSLSALAPHPLTAYYNPYSIYARTTIGLHP